MFLFTEFCPEIRNSDPSNFLKVWDFSNTNELTSSKKEGGDVMKYVFFIEVINESVEVKERKEKKKKKKSPPDSKKNRNKLKNSFYPKKEYIGIVYLNFFYVEEHHTTHHSA